MNNETTEVLQQIRSIMEAAKPRCEACGAPMKATEAAATDGQMLCEACRTEAGPGMQRAESVEALTEEPGPVVAKVPSESNPEKTYDIRLGKDGNFYCSCPAWKNQKKPVKERMCKHIKAWGKAMNLKLPEGSIIVLADGEEMVIEMSTEKVGALLDEAKKKSRFARLAKMLSKRDDVENPEALAAWIGRKKYGAKKFNKMALAGRK